MRQNESPLVYFQHMPRPLNVAVVGAQGGLGQALISQLLQLEGELRLWGLSRSGELNIDLRTATNKTHKYYSMALNLQDPSSIQAAATELKKALNNEALHLCLVCTGRLHGSHFAPEKKLEELQATKLLDDFAVNTVGPALIAQAFLPLMPRKDPSIFASFSARVGSISDNRLGGWYGYRASKAALNMMIKTTAIEMKRRKPGLIFVGYHPGTVDTPLSKPFQRNVPSDKLFQPEFASQRCLKVLSQLQSEDSGKIFDWQGLEIKP